MSSENTWDGVARIAASHGCRYSALVAAQWALESGWGQHAPGNNYLGLKGPGTGRVTREYSNGQWITITDEFLSFKSLQACIQYLVERWYKDWKQYKGIDRCSTIEEAANQLVAQGYATDPLYSQKLLRLIKDHHKPTSTPSTEAIVITLKANHATVLKKAPIDSRYLSETGKRAIAIGDVLKVRDLEEIASDSHAWVTLDDGERWAVYGPHFEHSPGQPAPGRIDWRKFDALIGEYITVGEVLQYDARRVPVAGSEEERNILEICRQFDAIRRAWGSALGVTSGYRPEPINRQVGGVSGSMHVSGRALDIYPIGRSLAEFHQWLIKRWSGGYGDGRNRGFIHIDTRGNGHFSAAGGLTPWRVWTY